MANQTQKSTLIIEDDILLADHCKDLLHLDGWQAMTANSAGEGLEILRNNPPHALLLDIYLPDANGLDILDIINKERIPVVVVVMTGKGSVDLAVSAMRRGAFDFFEKPVETVRLLTTMGNALQHQQAKIIIQQYEESAMRGSLHKMIGVSLPMQTVFRIIDSVAQSKASVFITGASGTGKELCAEAIHKQSRRSNKPFITINCAAIPNQLMESEIFGHVKGAFSDAMDHRQGAASMAEGGTLFLDEICEMDLELQGKLLRFIQSGSIKKVGSDQEETVDIRFICATNRDPREQINKGSFREDLFFRLHVVPIPLPSLHERGEDVLLLAQHFLVKHAKEEGKKFRSIAADAATAFLQHEWPGNVRELQNIIQHSVVIHDGKKLRKEHLPPPLDNITSQQPYSAKTLLNTSPNIQLPSQIIPLQQLEMNAIEEAITKCGGNIKLAAELLQVDQSTIYRKRSKWKQKEQQSV